VIAMPSIRSAYAQLLLLALAAWATTYVRFLLSPLQETIRLDLALSDNLIAMLQGPALALPKILLAVPLGLAIDRLSRSRLVLFFVALALVSGILLSRAESYQALIVARLLTGLAGTATITAVYALVADHFAAERRGRATMIVAFAEIGGAPAAFAMGGALLTVFGPGLSSWHEAALWMTFAILPIFALMLLLREPARSQASAVRIPIRDAWPGLWSYRHIIVPLLAARVMVWIADGAALVWAAPAFSRHLNLSPAEVGGVIASILLASSIIGPFAGGLMADACQRRGGPRRTLAAMAVLALWSAPAALFAVVPTVWGASLTLGVFLTLGYLIGTAAIALSTIVVPGELRGLFISISTGFGALFGIGIAPISVSLVSDMVGGPQAIGWAMAAVGGIASISAAVALALGRRMYAYERGTT
jgi:MFS family permease